jgi:hypothetical protein
MPDAAYGLWDALRALTKRVHRLEITDARQRLVEGSSVTYDGSGSGLSGGNAQDAIDEVAQDHIDHLNDSADAHDASAVSIVDAGGYFTGTDVEAALQELGADGGLGDVTLTGTPAAGDVIVATSASAATWRSAADLYLTESDGAGGFELVFETDGSLIVEP